MKKAMVILALALVATTAKSAEPYTGARTVDECIARGKSYEAEAGVIVKPSVEARCKRQIVAFNFFKPFCINLSERDRIRKKQAVSNPDLLKSLEMEWAKADKIYPKCNF